MTAESARLAEGRSYERASAATWFGFSLMCLGMFMAILDVQIVATSLPSIQEALRIEPDAMSWIQTAYLTAEVVAIPLTGWLTRVLTMRWLFVGATGLFTLASICCALSGSLSTLVAFRIIQGFSGGMLIPLVFSAVFLLFPKRDEGLATMIAGVLAVLAPTFGPIAGGWITKTYSWHWLFLVNVTPGLIAVVLTPALLPRDAPDLRHAKTLDSLSLILLIGALACLEIGLKQAPRDGWTAASTLTLLGASILSGSLFVRRTMRAAYKIVDLATLKTLSFAVGCVLSFCLGVGLFGSVYLMPVFLAYVRDHDSLQIGTIMLVTGLAQLATAPLVVRLETKIDARLLAGFGFVLFALGLGASAFETRETDFDAMFWPQILRGVAIMFCLLPPTRIALGCLPAAQVPDASGLFNLMRNLGGAIGLALVDTVLYGRIAIHAEALKTKLMAGDASAARALGLSPRLVAQKAAAPIDAATAAYLRPLIAKAAFVMSANEAWILLAAFSLVALAGMMLLTRTGLTGGWPDGRSRQQPSTGVGRHKTVTASVVVKTIAIFFYIGGRFNYAIRYYKI
jgi:MFS transporter, DHA2 family, multidrug resistance protein